MHTQSLRGVLGEQLHEINSPKPIANLDCLR
jgi:hypothetical protein